MFFPFSNILLKPSYHFCVELLDLDTRQLEMFHCISYQSTVLLHRHLHKIPAVKVLTTAIFIFAKVCTITAILINANSGGGHFITA